MSSKPKREDIDTQGGWLVGVKTSASLDRLLYVYELDWVKTKELAKPRRRLPMVRLWKRSAL
jgi:hypothetical protein